MNIQTITREGTITLKLDGWLDTISAPELGAEVEKITAATAIVLDFENVEYMASSGLRQVVACHKKAKELGAGFSVINASTETMSIFQLTGIDKKLNVRKKEP